MRLKILATISVLALAACANNKPTYEWSDYPTSLLKYYKNPGETEKFEKSLAAIIKKGEASNKVPPGMYAEYGYVLIELGNAQDAVVYFQRERDRWPESAFLMDKLIVRLSQSSAQKSGEAPVQRQ